MAAVGWNFERRRSVCARFLVGVWVLTHEKPVTPTSLEAVRSRMKLPSEDALFAARTLNDEQLVTFDKKGPVQSTPKGLSRAVEMMTAVTQKLTHFEEIEKTANAGGLPLEMLRIVLCANGGVMECGSPETDPDGIYRLVLTGDALAVERKNDQGVFEGG